MSTLAELKNKLECGADSVLGTGYTKFCIKQIKKAVTLMLMPIDYEFASDEEFTESFIRTEQQKGNVIVLKGVTQVEDQSADDTLETDEDGTEQVTNLGKYKFRFHFKNGLDFHSALESLSGFRRWSVAMVDAENQILGTIGVVDNDAFKGFTTTQVQYGRLQMPTSAQAQKEFLTIQLAERKELDANHNLIQPEFNALNLDGIYQTKLSFVNAPQDGDTSLVVRATYLDGTHGVSGMDETNFVVTSGGSDVSVSAVTESSTTPGEYTLTIPALTANQITTVREYDATLNKAVINLDNTLFQSNILSATVV
ncbi:hypothetical protein [Joostella sp. CR20]|uniref:hypothetical protein n=1 Tax=Joostella sp. CR20 TaxID=2804312 RepID=UPI00313E876B